MSERGTHLRWPADRFFWAVLEAPGLTRPGALPEGLRAAFADEVPVDSPLHAVFAPLDQGRVLACGLPAESLANLPSDALTLRPAGSPAFLPARVRVEDLNLLTGRYEPLCFRKSRFRRQATLAAAMLACAGLISIGFWRRGSIAMEQAHAARAACERVLGEAGGEAGEPQAELRRLRESADRVALRDRRGRDAALDLAALLVGWPSQSASAAQSIAVGADGASLTVTIQGHAAEFLDALSPPPGWVIDEPRLNTIGDATRVSVRIRPPAGGKS